MFAYRLQNREIRLISVVGYGLALKQFAQFLGEYYSNLESLVNIPYDRASIEWHSFLLEMGLSSAKSRYRNASIFNQLYDFFKTFYDIRDEYEKDIWDCRKIPGAKITETSAHYFLHFTEIPLEFRNLAKRYIKFRTTRNSQGQCKTDIMALRLFTKYIHENEPLWKDLKMLTRQHMEAYLTWYRGYTEGWKKSHSEYLISLRGFLSYIQRAMYPEAPETPAVCLLFKEDFPRMPQKTENEIKYIPEGVLQQLEFNIEKISPSEYVPILIILRASGWRISDVLALRYDTCLDRTSQGWWLCGDIVKTQVLNHRVPITDEVAAVIQAVVDETKEGSTEDNNPNHLLFVRYDGKRKGRCPQGGNFQKALNQLAKAQNIVDDQGHVFHFCNHAFRHTKAVELINNGMNLLHVQKWMAHASPEMSLRYAKILDTTMRKSWEEATKLGLFRVSESGKFKKVDISEVLDEDMIEWEYIRHNLDAVRMPLGYCMKPKKQECYTQLNPCLTCRNLCTTPDFISQYEVEARETKALIERGRAQGQSVWVEKNTTVLKHYEEVLSVLKEGKIYHLAGKRSREYVGEERNNVNKP